MVASLRDDVASCIEDHCTDGQPARAQRLVGEFETSPHTHVSELPLVHR